MRGNHGGKSTLWRGGSGICLFLLVFFCGLHTLPAAESSGADGIFSSLFGNNFRVTGGNLRYLPEKKAILIRDYATIVLYGKEEGEWRRLRARNIVFFTESQKIYAEGNVSVEDSSGTYMNCDRIYFDNKTFKGRARNVRLRTTDEGFNKTASVEEKNVAADRPTMEGSNSIFAKIGSVEEERRIRMNVATEDMRLISKDHYEATDVSASPSNYARPHWSVHSQAVHMRRGEKVEAYNNVFKIGKVPVFYVPYLVYDLKYRWPYYRVGGGYDKRQGVSILNRIGWKFQHEKDVDEQGRPIQHLFQLDDIFADIDVRTNRGWGFGGESGYSDKFLGKGTGNIRGYWTKENYISDGEDARRAREDVQFRGNDWGANPGYTPALYEDKNRYMLEWWHRQEFTDSFDLRMQTHWFSDRDFEKEYFRNYWAQNEDQSTNATLRYIGDLFQTELVTQGRINEFASESEYLPEWRASLPGTRLWSLPVFIESTNRAGLIRRRDDVMLEQLGLLNPQSRTQTNGDTPWIGRLHTMDELSVPVDLGPVALRAHGGGFLSGYSTGYNDNYGQTSDGKFNAAGIYGLDASSRFFGYFKEDSLKHMIEPTLKFIGHEAPVTSRNDLFNVDEVDSYRESHMIAGNVYQQIQTKNAKGQARTLADVNVGTGVIIDQDEADKYNRGNLLTDINTNFGLFPTDALSIYGNMAYNMAFNSLDTASIGADYWFSKKLRLFLNHTYTGGTFYDLDSYYDPNMYNFDTNNASNLTTAAVRTQLWDKHSRYSLEYAVSYEWNEDAPGVIAPDGTYRGEVNKGLHSQRIGLIRDLDTFELSLNWIINHQNNGSSSYFVNIKPKGWVGARPEADHSYAELDEANSRYAHPVPQKMRNQDTSYNVNTPAWE